MILRADAIGSPLHERRPPTMTRPGYQMISHITSGDCCIAPVSTELGSTSAGLRGRLSLPHTYTKQTTSRGRLQRERVPFTGVSMCSRRVHRLLLLDQLVGPSKNRRWYREP